MRRDIDVDGNLHFAQHVLTDASRIWVEIEPEAKRRFEQHLYPDGLAYEPDAGFRTAPNCPLFRPLELPRESASRVVHPGGLEPPTLGLGNPCSIRLSYGCSLDCNDFHGCDLPAPPTLPHSGRAFRRVSSTSLPRSWAASQAAAPPPIAFAA